MPYPESYPMQVNMYNNANGELLATHLGLTKSDCKIGNILSFDTGSDSIPKTVTLTVSFEIRKVRQLGAGLLGVFVVLKGRVNDHPA